MSDLYLRDLKQDLQDSIIRSIEKTNPNLSKRIEEGEDILIGHYIDMSEYSVVQ